MKCSFAWFRMQWDKFGIECVTGIEVLIREGVGLRDKWTNLRGNSVENSAWGRRLRMVSHRRRKRRYATINWRFVKNSSQYTLNFICAEQYTELAPNCTPKCFHDNDFYCTVAIVVLPNDTSLKRNSEPNPRPWKLAALASNPNWKKERFHRAFYTKSISRNRLMLKTSNLLWR